MTPRSQQVDRLVGERVRLLRVAAGMSQTSLGSHIGVTFQQVQKYEKGTNRISASALVSIAGALGVTVADLFEGATDREPSRSSDTYIPSASDLAIVRTLAEIDDPKLKRQILGLITALANGS